MKEKLGSTSVELSKLERSGKMPDNSLISLNGAEQIRSIKFQNKVIGFGLQAFLYSWSKSTWGKLID